MKASFDHTIPSPIDKVLEAYKSKEFYEAKQRASGATSVECIDYNDDGKGTIRMSHRCSEPSRLPSFVRKADVDTYTDDSVLDLNAKTLSWKVTPQTGADKFRLSGKVIFQDVGGQTKITFEATMEVKIPLVGKKAEKIGLAKMEEETTRQADFVRQWVADH